MSDQPIHLELETDDQAIAAFVQRHNARTEARLTGAAYDADVDAAAAILEDPSTLLGITRRGTWLYTFRQTEANPRGIWLRLPEGADPAPDADWQPVFDVDRFCAETDQVWHWRGAVTAWFNPDRVLLCLSLDGSDQVRHLEFDCSTAQPVPGGFDVPTEKAIVDWLDADTLVWASGGEGAATRSGWPGQVRRLSRGMPPGDAPVLYRADPDDVVIRAYVVPTAGGSPLVCTSRIVEIGQEEVTLHPEGEPSRILPTPPDTEVANTDTHYAWIVREQGGTPGTLMLGRVGHDDARVLFTPRGRRVVDPYSLVLSRDWMLWTEVDALRPELFALDLRDMTAQPRPVAPPEPADTLGVGHFDSIGLAGDGTLQLYITGFLCSPRIYLFDLKNGVDGIQWRLLHRAPEAFDATGMEVRLLEATSDDGTAVPYHVVLPRDHETHAGDLPVLLYGYGGFGASMEPYYSRLTGALWLARGGAFAMAHIRGGAEMGPEWHLQAKGAGRTLAFQDFAAIASDLVDRGLSRPRRIACHGGSNGGLLCGVMLTRYPERFGAVWASVGVFDMTRFHTFPAGRAWIDEYGDPDDAEAREWLLAYSPLHKVPPSGQALPPSLIDTSAHDDRVDPSHARRFVAALEAAGHTPWFYQHGDGGHGGGGASRTQAREQVLGYRFLYDALDMEV